MDKARRKDKAHIVYKNAKGDRVPGASTVARVLDKPALLYWSNKLGLDGIAVSKYVDGLADAGTLAHYFVECIFQEKERDPEYMKEFSQVDIDRANISFKKFEEWYLAHKVKVIRSEWQLVSEEFQVGGTLDAIAEVDGVLTLIDIKTAKAIYGKSDDKWIQLAGYDIIAREHGFECEECRILRIGRDEQEGFEYALMPHREEQRDLFKLCKLIYEVRKRIGK